jgi:hypothetical protein
MKCDRLSVPRYCGELIHDVNTGQCHDDLRLAGESTLYSTVVCSDIRTCTAPQKCAGGPAPPDRVHWVDDTVWQAATPLAGSGMGKGHLSHRGPARRCLSRTSPRMIGTKWTGIGGGSLPETLLSSSLTRAALNSRDGYDVVHSALDTFFVLAIGSTSMTHTGERLVAIEGGFKTIGPFKFQEKASWYSDRCLRDDAQSLLVCLAIRYEPATGL